MFLLAGGGVGYNFNFSLNLPQTLLLVCFFFFKAWTWRVGGVVVGEVGRGGEGCCGGEVGRNREQNV